MHELLDLQGNYRSAPVQRPELEERDAATPKDICTKIAGQ